MEDFPHPPPTADPRRALRLGHGAALVALALLALVLRLLYLRQCAGLPFFDEPVGESAVHLQLAREIVAGAVLPSRPFFYASVLYPYFLAGVLGAGGNLFLVCLLQIVAGGLLVFVLGALATRLYGPRAGLATAILAALYGPFAFLEADVVGIVWALLGVAAALWLAVRWDDARERAGSVAPLGLAGLALGVAAAERPNLALLVPVVALWSAWRSPARRLRPAAAVAAGAALPLFVVVALNFAAAGQWIPLATSRGLNFYIGFNERANGTYDEPWAGDAQFDARHTELEEASTTMASRLSGRALTAEQASDFWSARALAFIRAHPSRAAALTVRKTALLLNDAEVPNHLDYAFIRRHAPALWTMPLGFGVVVAFAAAGLVVLIEERRRRAGTALLLLVAATAAASVLPFFVADRYRAPMVPPLLVLAGAGVVEMGALLVRTTWRRERRTAWLLAATAGMALVAHVPLVRPLLSRDYWIFAQAYSRRGDVPAAAAAYEEAVRAEGEDGELLNNLALAYRDLGQRDRAEATLRRAIAASPGLAYPHKNLGMMLIGRGDLAGAWPELVQTVRLEPGDAEAWSALGALAAERGAWTEAAAAFGHARALAPRDERLRRLIASYPDVAARAAAAARR